MSTTTQEPTTKQELIPASTSQRGAAELVGLAAGVVYLAVGAVGFLVTTGVSFATSDGRKLLGIFGLNPLHNVVHLAIGGALVAGYLMGRHALSVIAGLMGATYLLVAVAGPFLNGGANILALNTADNLLHLGSALVLIAVAWAASRTTSPAG